MGVCRYFLQGNCWYGDNCRFEHPRNAYSGNDFSQPNRFASLTPHSGGGQPNRGGRPGGAGAGAATNVKDLSADDIINIVSQEMAQWEQTHMWQFSCFSYTKETPCLPGLEDVSHEEVRLKAYEAQKAGNFDSYKQWIAQLATDYKAKKKELINPSPQMRIKLKEVINTLKAATPGSVASEPVKGTFGFGPGFGAPSSSQFSGATGDGAHSQPLFGSSQPTAAFAGSPAANQSTALFGAASQPGGFGGGASTFGSSATGLFGKPAPAAAGNLFGGGTTTTQPTGLFGKPPPTTQASTFAGGAQPIFGGSTGTFGGSASFGAAPPGGAVQSSSGAAVAQNLFGGAQQGAFGSAQTSFGGTSQPTQTAQPSAAESSLYTPLDKLTAEEKTQFEAPTFTLGKIPTRPPARELV